MRTQKYWFPAKRYGWGWGLPSAWQGWVVLTVWFAAFYPAERYLIPHDTYAHVAFALGMVGVLSAICYKKGEPLRWRSGDRH